MRLIFYTAVALAFPTAALACNYRERPPVISGWTEQGEIRGRAYTQYGGSATFQAGKNARGYVGGMQDSRWGWRSRIGASISLGEC